MTRVSVGTLWEIVRFSVWMEANRRRWLLAMAHLSVCVVSAHGLSLTHTGGCLGRAGGESSLELDSLLDFLHQKALGRVSEVFIFSYSSDPSYIEQAVSIQQRAKINIFPANSFTGLLL